MTISWGLLNVRPLWNLSSSLRAKAIGCKWENRRRCCLDLIKRQNSFSFHPEIASSELFLFCRKYSISYQHTLWRQIQKRGMINFWLTWPAKVHLVKATVFPVVMYRCESWTIKKAEHQRIDVFELWYWRRLLRVPWTARRSNQSILKEINPEYSLKGLMLKLKLQYFGHLMWRTDSLEKTLMLGKIEDRTKRDHGGWDVWMASLTWWTWVWASSRSWWWTGNPGVLQSVESPRVGHDWMTELTDWTELTEPQLLVVERLGDSF